MRIVFSTFQEIWIMSKIILSTQLEHDQSKKKKKILNVGKDAV